MGACCSCHRIKRFDGAYFFEDHNDVQAKAVAHEDHVLGRGDAGAHVRLQGYSKQISMFNQQGHKGLNQDAMTVWENFTGDKDTFFCGVFDGHGPSGHKVAQYIRDILPSKLSSTSKSSSASISSIAVEHGGGGSFDNEDTQFFNSWKARMVKSFMEMDEELEGNSQIESYCSGTTAVTVIKQKDHLIIANLGDSRAVMCTRDDEGQLFPEQLTVDLKPNLPDEAERIRRCQGRIMAMEAEPNVYRIWMPDEDCPGLAMARAFGDFCLKDFGLIATPEIFYRRLSPKDEFVVLATDGVWDVLSNSEVIRIVASTRKRSLAARLLVDRAVRAWRYKYPCAKIDDCAVICLFFKRQRPSLTKSVSEVTELSLNYTELEARSHASAITDDALDTVLNCEVKDSTEEADPQGHARRRRQRSGMTSEQFQTKDETQIIYETQDQGW